jgi:FlaA1/EpsC-like NDP-sugar epimerase
MERTSQSRIYIIGAGFAGQTLAAEIKRKAIYGEVVAFLDDDAAKIGTRIDAIPVLGPIKDVVKLLIRNPADEAIIAIPSASRTYIRELYELLTQAGFTRIRILPSVAQIIEGTAHLVQTREIDPQDLLGRDPVAIGLKESLKYLRGKRVLVTGAGGSIGSEICRQLLSGGAERIYLFGHGENSIYQIDRELRLLQKEGVGEKATIVPIIGELKDRSYMEFILKRVKADVIFHCAAYKHVPMMEENPVAAIENNVFGTKNLVDAADAAGVKRFVLISTDKAVNPSCVYGVSKYFSELEVLEKNLDKNKHFMVVRFGNVLGSRGSIMPLFQKQIESGGPVTITHPDATRFFMTIPEACSLVLKAGGVGQSGMRYLLDMGEPVRIKDLAEQMIRFNGFEPERDIKIEVIGLRRGERVHESLHNEREKSFPTEFPGINRLEEIQRNGFTIGEAVERLRPVCFFDESRPEAYRNRKLLRAILKEYVPSLLDAEQESEY